MGTARLPTRQPLPLVRKTLRTRETQRGAKNTERQQGGGGEEQGEASGGSEEQGEAGGGSEEHGEVSERSEEQGKANGGSDGHDGKAGGSQTTSTAEQKRRATSTAEQGGRAKSPPSSRTERRPPPSSSTERHPLTRSRDERRPQPGWAEDSHWEGGREVWPAFSSADEERGGASPGEDEEEDEGQIGSILRRRKEVFEEECLGGLSSAMLVQVVPSDVSQEKERFWSELDEVMESIPMGERVVIGADFNGHVGEGNRGGEEVTGKFGLEGQMVVDFAKRMDMAVVNAYFQKREEHRVTYKSGGRRTQVDYILCRRGNLKEISDCKVVVGESVARQHRMVVCRMTLMVCKKKRSKIEKKTKWWKLKKDECCEEFRQKFRQALGGQVVLPDDQMTGKLQQK
ncbi:hypothetical protein QTP70_024749 [Hemibagrus guttatus]|uniref:Endonuclease/exonuclease/phosphatase domain-containing protein n=1 Tax=Hemibagrus guttatus TaxID=175788 RepID=A0AAE0RLN5_9TELE|nr:hypothetical protein QTP70_024749 [Hemibagrus guttatus]KAK3575023.1 hypothetical protein QTP86_019798 [Hemibagrus guttatus]